MRRKNEQENSLKFRNIVFAMILATSLFLAETKKVGAQVIQKETELGSTYEVQKDQNIVFAVTSKSSGLGTLDRVSQESDFYFAQMPEEPLDNFSETDINPGMNDTPRKILSDGREYYEISNAGFVQVIFGTEADTEGLNRFLIQMNKSFTRDFKITGGSVSIFYTDDKTKKTKEFKFTFGADGGYGLIYQNIKFDEIIFQRYGSKIKSVVGADGFATLYIPFSNLGGNIQGVNFKLDGTHQDKKGSITWKAVPSAISDDDPFNTGKKAKKEQPFLIR